MVKLSEVSAWQVLWLLARVVGACALVYMVLLLMLWLSWFILTGDLVTVRDLVAPAGIIWFLFPQYPRSISERS